MKAYLLARKALGAYRHQDSCGVGIAPRKGFDTRIYTVYTVYLDSRITGFWGQIMVSSHARANLTPTPMGALMDTEFLRGATGEVRFTTDRAAPMAWLMAIVKKARLHRQPLAR